MAISANSVFHFTDSLENLISILKNEFCPRYSLEEFVYSGVKVAIPMVCFCDIPLSQTKNHIKTYGPYGLGMKKEWAKEKGLNPVLYLQRDSILHKNLKNVFLHAVKLLAISAKKSLKKKEKLTEEPDWIAILNIIRYTKMSKGNLFKIPKKKNIKFYEEREWRYVPNIMHSPEIFLKIWLSETGFQNKQERETEEKILENYKLTFDPDDIKYVIVKNDNEIGEIIKQLRTIKRKYSYESVDILCSRIITSEQIKDDF